METRIYAITDSHQESRNLSKLLSGIYNFEKNNDDPFLILDAGDLFKGIYNKDLSVNAYLKIKEMLPQSQIFIAIGNNDFGFTKSDFEYLKKTSEVFKAQKITMLCANLIDLSTNDYADWVERYKIVDINGQRILITGFCLDNSCAKRFKCELIPPEITFNNLINEINEDFDKIVVLNHHWYSYSKHLKEFAQSKGITIDLIIGGHEHSPIKPDFENNIFYPLSFARTLYRLELDETIQNVKEYGLEDIDFIEDFELPIIQYEQETELKKPIAKRILDLTKCYSDPCPLGTFISDTMRAYGNTDIAFHSTGFTMYPLRLSDGNTITRYDLERVMCVTTACIVKAELSVAQLKKVFENATMLRMYRNRGNSRFLQCSRNIEIVGKGNPNDNTYKIIQIRINEEDLLDKNQNPINPERIYTCTMDDYIASGEQGFEVLQNIPKSDVLKNNQKITLSNLFYGAVCELKETEKNNSVYPSFIITDL